MPFEISPTPIAGVRIVQRSRIGDERGFLCRLFASDDFAAAGMTKPVVHINQTVTRRRGTVRGMHYQHPPHAEMKVVSVLRGEIFDVALDLRHGSPTFLRWHGEVLSAGNQRALLIPEGVAHGFQSLADDSEILYLHTAAYAPSAEAAVNPTDPRLAIPWPLPIADMSDRDRTHALIGEAFEGVRL